MLEQEIKLHIPDAARAAVLKQLAALPGPRRVRLRAMYFDTADRQLGRQQAALRLRLEGRRWVQTFKMAGVNSMSRLELNHSRPGPELDLTVYEGTPAAKVIRAVGQALLVRYETDVMRLSREIRTRTGTVELACDVGWFRAGEIALPISELEFELVRGKPAALFTLAQRWRAAHDLKFDLRSKAERGDTLVTAWLEQEETAERAARALASYSLPRRPRNVSLSADVGAEHALRSITSECLDQMNRNALLLYRVDGLALTAEQEAEAAHQWRIAVRRLRCAWKWFDGQVVLPPREWREEARVLFAAMGEQRDEHVLQTQILPRLVAAGMPPLEAAASSRIGVAPARLLEVGEYEDWFMRLYQWTMTLPDTQAPSERPSRVSAAAGTAASSASSASSAPAAISAIPSASAGDAMAEAQLVDGGRSRRDQGRDAARGNPAREDEGRAETTQADITNLLRKLRKWHRKFVKRGSRFDKISDEQRHKLRKLGKRLRYNLSFAEALLPPRRLRDYRQQLAVIQDELGQINDLVTARRALLERVETEPQAWFGIGWISATLVDKYAQARREFVRLEDLKPFWGKRL